MHGMHITFLFSMVMMLVAAAASWLRGKRYVHEELTAAGEALSRPEVSLELALPASRPMVTLSAAYGAAGGAIGRALAQELGVPFIDRAIPASLAQRVASTLQQAFDSEERSSDGFGRMLAELRATSQLFGIQALSSSEEAVSEQDYRRLAQQAMSQLAATSGAVIVGHGAAAVLRTTPHVLRVAVGAPVETRTKRVMEIEGVDAETARRRIDAADSARRAYMRRLYGVSPEDPNLYHLVIDSSALPLDACVRLTLTALRGLSGSAETHNNAG